YAPNFDFISSDLKVSTSFTYIDEEGDDYFIAQDSIFTPEQGTFLPPFSNPTLTPTIRSKSMEKFNGHLNANFKGAKLTLIHSQELTNPIVSHLGIVTNVDQTIKETTQDLMSINYQWDVNDDLTYLFNAFYILNESKLFGQSEPPQIHGDEDQDGLNENFFSGIIENFQHQTRSFGLDLAVKYQINEQHQLLLGFNQNHTKLSEASKFANVSLAGRGPTEIFPAQDLTSEFISPGIKRKENAIYIQDNWAYSESTNITLGARFGDYSDFGSTSDPRLGINYRVSPKAYIKVLYGEAFKAPAFSQLFDATPTLSANRQRGNAQLEPTEIETFEWQLGYDMSEKLNSSVTLFNNNTYNEIFFDPTPGIEQWNNSGTRKSKGIELELKGAFLSFDIASVNYSYQSTSGVDIGAGANIHPPHRLNFYGVRSLSDNLNWSISYAYYSSPRRESEDDRERIDSKSILNMSLRRENFILPELSLELSAKNLLDDKGRFETEAALGLYDDLPIEGRRINLTAEYVFQ
ncbi:MAG: TonB-dependent receptor, partial [Kangiellaceae bacterium]|nr:TonB-dependent receptor [Kangiellaceae bacterium]